MTKTNCILVLCTFIPTSLTAAAAASPSQYNVRDFGAVGDGRHKDTAAMQSCHRVLRESGGGTVYLPPGRYLTGTIQLRSHITFEVGPGAVILGSEDPADYPLRDDPWGAGRKSISSLIYADDAKTLPSPAAEPSTDRARSGGSASGLPRPEKGMPTAQDAGRLRRSQKVRQRAAAVDRDCPQQALS